MASHNVYTFFSVHNCLDEDFDAPDAMADAEFCRGVVTGKMGLHPDGWDIRSALTAVMPQGFRGYEWVPEAYRRPIARSAAAIAEKPKPPRRKPGPKPGPAWHPHTPEPAAEGTLQLTCDVCERARFWGTMNYNRNRPVQVAAIRALAHQHGWTSIAGTDRCPACSQAVAPEPVGNGAGGNQGNEQHA